MELKYQVINGEKLAIFTFVDHKTRSEEITEWQKKVLNFYGVAFNHIEIDYRFINHGSAIEWALNSFGSVIDYFVFLDNDCIPTRSDFLTVVWEKIKDKRTVFGGVQNSNHIHTNHPFICPSSFCLSSALYSSLGRPHLGDLIKRSDTCEELTWKCQELGFNVCGIYPSFFNKLTKTEMDQTGNPEVWNLGNGLTYGLCTQYGDIFFHRGMQNIERGGEIFIDKCKEILGISCQSKIPVSAIIVSVNCADYLELTLPKNIDKCDNFYVATVETDIDTIKICEKYGANVVICQDPHNRNGHKFYKGYCIQECFKKITDRNRFVLLLDSDIILPESFSCLDFQSFNKDVLYGAQRAFAWDYNEYKQFADGVNSIDDFEIIPGGWGCGYFMLFYLNSSKIANQSLESIYPNGNLETDMVLLEKFHPDRKTVGKLFFNVLHLGPHGCKFNGRFNGQERFEEVRGKKFSEIPNIKSLLEE